MKTILNYAKLANAALDRGKKLAEISGIKSKDKLSEVKFTKDYAPFLADINKKMEQELNS